MNMTKFVLLIILSPLGLLAFHTLAVRLSTALKTKTSNQKQLIECILLFNLPMLYSCYLIFGFSAGAIGFYLYELIVYNSFAYFYFHFFNMSETARRIKILVSIYNKKIRGPKDFKAFYDTDKALSIRLKRLEQLGQLKKKGAVYMIKGRLLYYVSFLIPVFRSLLGFKEISPDMCS